jgi:hypothetical protein
MPHRIPGAVARQVESLQRQFAQAPGLPFAELLPADLIQQLCREHAGGFRRRTRKGVRNLFHSSRAEKVPDTFS